MVWLMVIGTAIVLYCTLSYLIRRYPGLLWSSPVRCSRRPPPMCFHISHRGGAGENIENTMTAFDHAADLGTEMFELDCQLTKDGQVVVAHDNNLLRLCGEDVLISDTMYKDLPPLLSTQRLDFNHKYSMTSRSADRHIILLKELFSRYPNMPMNVDVKRNVPELVQKVAALIQEFDRQHITILGNSNHATTEAIRKASPHTHSIYHMIEVIKLLLLWYTGLLPFVNLTADVLEIPMCSIFLEHFETFPEKAGSVALRLLLHVLDFSLTNARLIEHLKKRGVPTYFFVLNAEHEWRRAVECGAAGIMTDFPSKLKAWMKANGIKPHST